MLQCAQKRLASDTMRYCDYDMLVSEDISVKINMK